MVGLWFISCIVCFFIGGLVERITKQLEKKGDSYETLRALWLEKGETISVADGFGEVYNIVGVGLTGIKLRRQNYHPEELTWNTFKKRFPDYVRFAPESATSEEYVKLNPEEYKALVELSDFKEVKI